MRLLSFCAALSVTGSLAFGQDNGKPVASPTPPAPATQPTAQTPAAAPKPPPFSQVMKEHFSRWDADRDGTLSPAEVDKACVDPDVKGPAAAAVAAVKRIVRSEKYELPPLTLEYLTKTAPARPARKASGADTDREDSTEKTVKPEGAGDPKPAGTNSRPAAKPAAAVPAFQGRYVQCLTRIEKTDRDLFKGDDDVTIDHCHQGPLGDCFFVAPVGGMVKRNPAALRAMISPLTGVEGYNVKFGNGRVVRVSPLTDAEVAISSTTGDKAGQEGVWLAVLEKAFGTMRRDDNPSRYEMESATDAIAKGGSSSSVIQMLTGHRTDRIVLKRAKKGWIPDEFDRNKRRVAPASGTIVPTEPAGDVDALATKVRAGVKKALDAGRLVTTGTGEEHQPPGISGKHAYAVIAFDEAKDTLTLWNPHGNTFKPKGEPGRTTGYPTKAGIFDIPVKDFVRVFNGVTMETDRELPRRS